MNNTENVLYPAPTHRYKVLVVCNTYNHSKYIEETLNGFAIQQTNFPFTCLVMDDASTDGEQDVIKKWMEYECDTSKVEFIDFPASIVMIAPHKSNTSCIFAFYMLKHNLYKVEDQKMALVAPWREKCEYEAICEGDDYWTDPYKLQKQVDFLDANPEYSMCFHDVCRMRNNAILEPYRQYASNTDVPVEDVILNGGLFCPTASIVYRHELLVDYPDFARKCHVGDYPLQIYLALKGKIYFFADVMGCYRIGTPGSWTESMSKLDRTTILAKMDNEVEMLESFDRYSDNKYTHTFLARINNYKLLTYINIRDKSGVKCCYPYIYSLDVKNRILCFLIVNDLLFLIDIYRYIKNVLRLSNRWRRFIWRYLCLSRKTGW